MYPTQNTHDTRKVEILKDQPSPELMWGIYTHIQGESSTQIESDPSIISNLILEAAGSNDRVIKSTISKISNNEFIIGFKSNTITKNKVRGWFYDIEPKGKKILNEKYTADDVLICCVNEHKVYKKRY